MHARFLGKDPESHIDGSPTLFATDRTDRRTYIAQGWRVTDPQVLADVGPDYWLFDSRKLVRVHFDENDRFLGGEVIEDPAEIVQHNYWRDAAWHHAVERGDFAAKQGFGRIEHP